MRWKSVVHLSREMGREKNPRSPLLKWLFNELSYKANPARKWRFGLSLTAGDEMRPLICKQHRRWTSSRLRRAWAASGERIPILKEQPYLPFERVKRFLVWIEALDASEEMWSHTLV